MPQASLQKVLIINLELFKLLGHVFVFFVVLELLVSCYKLLTFLQILFVVELACPPLHLYPLDMLFLTWHLSSCDHLLLL
jgi:hypothetical protein